MDFDKVVSEHKSRTCVISVEEFSDGSYGNITMVAANKPLRDDAENIFHHPFEPGCPYYFCLPKDKNFEDFMYLCACKGKPLHTYVHVKQMDLWVNMFLLPLESDRENFGYCMYSCDISPYADPEQQASLAADTAANALEISLKLKSADQSNIRQVFDDIIEDIRKISGAEHCAVILADENDCEVFSRSDSENSSSADIYSSKSFGSIEKSFDSHINSSCLIVKDENDKKWLESAYPDFYGLMLENEVNSVILFPLKHNGKTLGYLWCLNYDTSDTVNIKETLELSSHLIASEISNYQLLKQLEILSSMDMLTGCKNRNAMNKFVDMTVDGKSGVSEYTVVFADLNGLKRINDEKGHVAGDAVIRTAAALLGQVFYDAEIYRAGGDEFVLIVPVTDSGVIEEKIKQLKEKSAIDPDVNFAAGYYIVKNGEDIRDAMKTADERMYADKELYYSEHPERKYR